MAENLYQRITRRLEKDAHRMLKQLLQRLRFAGRGGSHAAYVFVAGVQRSGTNMLMELFEKSYETDVYHETDIRAFDGYELRDIPVIRRLVARSIAPYFVIKTISDLDRLPALMTTFQPARVVWIVRRYEDVANSMLASFTSVPGAVERVARKGAAANWMGRGMSEATHALVQEHIARGLNTHSQAALMWYFRNVLFFELGFDKDPRVILIRYEDLATRPREECRRMFGFVGLQFHPRIVREVYTVSIGRRPKPKLDPEVAGLCDGLLARFASLSVDSPSSAETFRSVG